MYNSRGSGNGLLPGTTNGQLPGRYYGPDRRLPQRNTTPVNKGMNRTGFVTSPFSSTSVLSAEPLYVFSSSTVVSPATGNGTVTDSSRPLSPSTTEVPSPSEEHRNVVSLSSPLESVARDVSSSSSSSSPSPSSSSPSLSSPWKKEPSVDDKERKDKSIEHTVTEPSTKPLPPSLTVSSSLSPSSGSSTTVPLRMNTRDPHARSTATKEPFSSSLSSPTVSSSSITNRGRKILPSQTTNIDTPSITTLSSPRVPLSTVSSEPLKDRAKEEENNNEDTTTDIRNAVTRDSEDSQPSLLSPFSPSLASPFTSSFPLNKTWNSTTFPTIRSLSSSPFDSTFPTSSYQARNAQWHQQRTAYPTPTLPQRTPSSAVRNNSPSSNIGAAYYLGTRPHLSLSSPSSLHPLKTNPSPPSVFPSYVSPHSSFPVRSTLRTSPTMHLSPQSNSNHHSSALLVQPSPTIIRRTNGSPNSNTTTNLSAVEFPQKPQESKSARPEAWSPVKQSKPRPHTVNTDASSVPNERDNQQGNGTMETMPSSLPSLASPVMSLPILSQRSASSPPHLSSPPTAVSKEEKDAVDKRDISPDKMKETTESKTAPSPTKDFLDMDSMKSSSIIQKLSPVVPDKLLPLVTEYPILPLPTVPYHHTVEPDAVPKRRSSSKSNAPHTLLEAAPVLPIPSLPEPNTSVHSVSKEEYPTMATKLSSPPLTGRDKPNKPNHRPSASLPEFSSLAPPPPPPPASVSESLTATAEPKDLFKPFRSTFLPHTTVPKDPAKDAVSAVPSTHETSLSAPSLSAPVHDNSVMNNMPAPHRFGNDKHQSIHAGIENKGMLSPDKTKMDRPIRKHMVHPTVEDKPVEVTHLNASEVRTEPWISQAEGEGTNLPVSSSSKLPGDTTDDNNSPSIVPIVEESEPVVHSVPEGNEDDTVETVPPVVNERPMTPPSIADYEDDKFSGSDALVPTTTDAAGSEPSDTTNNVSEKENVCATAPEIAETSPIVLTTPSVLPDEMVPSIKDTKKDSPLPVTEPRTEAYAEITPEPDVPSIDADKPFPSSENRESPTELVTDLLSPSRTVPEPIVSSTTVPEPSTIAPESIHEPLSFSALPPLPHPILQPLPSAGSLLPLINQHSHSHPSSRQPSPAPPKGGRNPSTASSRRSSVGTEPFPPPPVPVASLPLPSESPAPILSPTSAVRVPKSVPKPIISARWQKIKDIVPDIAAAAKVGYIFGGDSIDGAPEKNDEEHCNVPKTDEPVQSVTKPPTTPSPLSAPSPSSHPSSSVPLNSYSFTAHIVPLNYNTVAIQPQTRNHLQGALISDAAVISSRRPDSIVITKFSPGSIIVDFTIYPLETDTFQDTINDSGIRIKEVLERWNPADDSVDSCTALTAFIRMYPETVDKSTVVGNGKDGTHSILSLSVPEDVETNDADVIIDSSLPLPEDTLTTYNNETVSTFLPSESTPPTLPMDTNTNVPNQSFTLSDEGSEQFLPPSVPVPDIPSVADDSTNNYTNESFCSINEPSEGEGNRMEIYKDFNVDETSFLQQSRSVPNETKVKNENPETDKLLFLSLPDTPFEDECIFPIGFLRDKYVSPLNRSRDSEHDNNNATTSANDTTETTSPGPRTESSPGASSVSSSPSSVAEDDRDFIVSPRGLAFVNGVVPSQRKDATKNKEAFPVSTDFYIPFLPNDEDHDSYSLEGNEETGTEKPLPELKTLPIETMVNSTINTNYYNHQHIVNDNKENDAWDSGEEVVLRPVPRSTMDPPVAIVERMNTPVSTTSSDNAEDTASVSASIDNQDTILPYEIVEIILPSMPTVVEEEVTVNNGTETSDGTVPVNNGTETSDGTVPVPDPVRSIPTDAAAIPVDENIVISTVKDPDVPGTSNTTPVTAPSYTEPSEQSIPYVSEDTTVDPAEKDDTTVFPFVPKDELSVTTVESKPVFEPVDIYNTLVTVPSAHRFEGVDGDDSANPGVDQGNEDTLGKDKLIKHDNHGDTNTINSDVDNFVHTAEDKIDDDAVKADGTIGSNSVTDKGNDSVHDGFANDGNNDPLNAAMDNANDDTTGVDGNITIRSDDLTDVPKDAMDNQESPVFRNLDGPGKDKASIDNDTTGDAPDAIVPVIDTKNDTGINDNGTQENTIKVPTNEEVTANIPIVNASELSSSTVPNIIVPETVAESVLPSPTIDSLTPAKSVDSDTALSPTVLRPHIPIVKGSGLKYVDDNDKENNGIVHVKNRKTKQDTVPPKDTDNPPPNPPTIDEFGFIIIEVDDDVWGEDIWLPSNGFTYDSDKEEDNRSLHGYVVSSALSINDNDNYDDENEENGVYTPSTLSSIDKMSTTSVLLPSVPSLQRTLSEVRVKLAPLQ